MFTMRLAAESDAPGVASMINARCAWMEQRGLESWREDVDDLAGQAGGGSMWVLQTQGRIVGCTTVMTEAPPKDWTPEEAAEPALYLFTTITDPAYREHKPGTLIALWAVDRAARMDRAWVRRGASSRSWSSTTRPRGSRWSRNRTGARDTCTCSRVARSVSILEYWGWQDDALNADTTMAPRKRRSAGWYAISALPPAVRPAGSLTYG